MPNFSRILTNQWTLDLYRKIEGDVVHPDFRKEYGKSPEI